MFTYLPEYWNCLVLFVSSLLSRWFGLSSPLLALSLLLVLGSLSCSGRLPLLLAPPCRPFPPLRLPARLPRLRLARLPALLALARAFPR